MDTKGMEQTPTPTQAIHHPTNRKHTGKRPKSLNQLQKGIQEFVTRHLPPSALSDHGLSPETLVSSLPKRYTVYEPMLLLPVNALNTPPGWSSLYKSLDDDKRQALYASLAKAFSRMGVTHVAINAPIALTDTQGHDNRMRSPVGLIPLHGDFGPMPSGDGENGEQPSEDDFQRAFWVSTMQNHGITQVWCPLYTMFSRGNITEKARILGDQGPPFEGLDADALGEEIGNVSVVDMYAGIGYFVFSYLKRGVKRVWGWEINGWSVEGLRRGCIANGWNCKVVRIRDDGALSETIPELVADLRDSDKVVIFHGDNRFAADILSQVRDVVEAEQSWSSIRHANLGLLPSSSDAWDNACKMIDLQKGGWVHVHENVDVQEIEQKKDEIASEMGRLRAQALGLPEAIDLTVDCRHIENVKTYAPGVMHCVFDMKLPSHGEVYQKKSI